MSIYLSVCVSACLSVFGCLSVSLCVCLSVWASVCLPVSVCVHVFVTDCLSVCEFLSVSLSVCMSSYLCVCQSVCLCLDVCVPLFESVYLSVSVRAVYDYLCVCLCEKDASFLQQRSTCSCSRDLCYSNHCRAYGTVALTQEKKRAKKTWQ